MVIACQGPIGGIGTGKHPAYDFKSVSKLVDAINEYDQKGRKYSQIIDKILGHYRVNYLNELPEEAQEDLLLELKNEKI